MRQTTLCFAMNLVNAHSVVKRRKTAIIRKKVRFQKLAKVQTTRPKRPQNLKTLPSDIVHSEQKGLARPLYWEVALPC